MASRRPPPPNEEEKKCAGRNVITYMRPRARGGRCSSRLARAIEAKRACVHARNRGSAQAHVRIHERACTSPQSRRSVRACMRAIAEVFARACACVACVCSRLRAPASAPFSPSAGRLMSQHGVESGPKPRGRTRFRFFLCSCFRFTRLLLVTCLLASCYLLPGWLAEFDNGKKRGGNAGVHRMSSYCACACAF